MQGQRGIVGSFSETLDFDHGSASAGTILDPQICWNNIRNPTENRMEDFILSPSHMNNAYTNPIDQERQTLSGWSLGEPSSSRAQIEISHDEQKLEHGWSSSTDACSGVGPRLGERQYEPSSIISLDSINASSQCLQSSNAEAGTRLNLNAGFVGHAGDNCQVLEGSNLYKDAVAEHEQIPPTSASNSSLLPSGSGGSLEENDGRPGCSSERQRQSCKRKAVEGNIGQSSAGGSSSFFQHSGSSSWPRVPANYGSGSNLSISPPSETVNPRLGLGLRALTTESIGDPGVGRAESSHRNFRLRINPSNQESPLPSFSSGSAVRRPSGSSSRWSSRPLQVDHSMEFRSSLAIDSPNPLCEPVVNPVAALPQEVHSTRWNGSSSLRIGSSSNPITVGDGEEGSSRSMTRSLWEHPMFVPATELRTSVRNPTNRTVTSRNSSVSGNVASTSRSGSSSGVHPSLAPTWAPHPNPPSRNSRRLAEYVRRSLFSSINAEPGGPSSSQSLPSGPPASTDETVLSSGSGSQALHRSYPRLASWMERQGDDVLGPPYPLRTLSASGEGRSRLIVSEHIRNVLDLMRRGEGLRFEDVMILDQSVLFGMADIHDRHRDMRLDVDNMSYEELLALEERIGNVSTGLSEETILSRLKQRKYYIAAGDEVEAEPCCICQEEYKDGEDLGTLDCQHDFHTHCVKQWLMQKNWCPICKTTGLGT